MKQWKILLALALTTALLAGCAGPETLPPAQAPVSVPAAPVDPAPASDPAPESVPEPEPPAGQELTLYVPDDQAMYLKEKTETLVLSPQGVVDALAERGVLPEDVVVNDFTLDGGHLFLDLSEPFREAVAASGTAGEQLLLGSLTNTLLRAYGAADLRLTCDGADLETGHNVYDAPLEFFDLTE